MLAQSGMEVGVASASLTWQWWLRGRLSPRRTVTEYLDIPEYRLEGPSLPKKTLWLWSLFTRQYLAHLQVVIRDWGQPDIMHVHNHQVIPAVMHIAERLDIPVVYTEHSTSFMTGHVPMAIRKRMATYMSSLFPAAVSQALADAMQPMSQSKVHVLPNYIDPAIFHPPLQSETSYSPRLITVSTLTARKQIDCLIQAFAKLVAKYPGATLTIVGYGPLEKLLKNLAQRLNLSQSVHFTGALDQYEVSDQLRRSTLFVAASRLETFGVMYVEALACGLPVVALDSLGVRDIIDDPALGTVVSDRSALEHEILLAVDRSNRYDRAHIYKTAIDRFGKEAVVEQHRSLYAQLLAQ